MEASHRLAAIMFTDIVGYTSMMGSDEQKAFDVLRKSRRIHWRLIKQHKGRWLKEMGDGTLASFNSSTQAVLCALAIQKACTDTDIPLRIGIHQGDVIFEKMDVLGNGVNIASRVQGIADTHGLAISETVYKDIANKQGLTFESLGRQALKGVEGGIEVYKVGCPDQSMLQMSVDTGELIRPLAPRWVPTALAFAVVAALTLAAVFLLPQLKPPAKAMGKSLMIMPFDNYTGSEDLDYFVSGMHSSLIGDVGKINALRVISKTTSNAYKDADKTIPEIASELNVDAVVEASVMCLGDSVCVQIRLVVPDTDGESLWVQEYKEEKTKILSLYNQVTAQISAEIDIALSIEEESKLAESRVVDTIAYDLYMRGQFYLDQIDIESLQQAANYFRLAIAQDSSWAPPHAGLAEVAAYQMQMGFVAPPLAIPVIYENLDKALELDLDASNVHYVTAIMAVWLEWDWEKGRREFEKALALNPSNALCRMFYAHFLMIMGEQEEGVEQARQAQQLDPLRTFILGLYSAVLHHAGHKEEAVRQAEKALSLEPGHHFATLMMDINCFNLGDYARSLDALMDMLRLEGNLRSSIEDVFDDQGYQAALRVIIPIVEEMEATGKYLPTGLAALYYRTGEYDKALDMLEKGYKIHDPNMPYLGSGTLVPDLRDNPRFEAIMDSMAFTAR